MIKSLFYGLGALASLLLLGASLTGRIVNSWQEVVAVITGAWCVWLTVKEHIWNWPIGLLNAAFSGVVYFESRLYADTTLQGVYFVLGILGWYWWLFGGRDRTELKIDRIEGMEALALLVAGIIATLGVRELLIRFNGSAPFLDALTTSMSLIAQYMLTRKYLENWIMWIAVDLIYVPLLWVRGLHLMAGLYFVFLVMAVAGLVEWLRRYEVLKKAA